MELTSSVGIRENDTSAGMSAGEVGQVLLEVGAAEKHVKWVDDEQRQHKRKQDGLGAIDHARQTSRSVHRHSLLTFCSDKHRTQLSEHPKVTD